MNSQLATVSTPLSDADTIKSIEKHIANPPMGSRVFTITPAVATYILDTYNTKNRPKKPASIAEYAGDMASDEWWVTGDTIKFSDAARLADGQNRLMACVRAGKPFTTHIVFQIEDAAFIAMDQNNRRGSPDQLHNAGYTNTLHYAAAIRWAYLLDNGRVKQRDTLKPDETVALAGSHYGGLKQYLTPAHAIYKQTGQPVGLVAAMLYNFHKKHPVLADNFAKAWAGGVLGGQYAVLGKLQKEIARIQTASSGRVHDVVRAALVVKAWNAFVEGRRGRASDFDWSITENFPAIK